MSAIAGVLHLDGSPVPRTVIERMAASLRHRSPSGFAVWCDGPLAIAQAHGAGSATTARPTHPAVFQGLGLTVAADARIDNAGEISRDLALGRGSIAPDEMVIARAYRRWGTDCPRHLIGDFAFVVWDSQLQRLLLARDPMGVRPLYVHRSSRLVAFASEAKALFTIPGIPREIDDLQIARFLVGDFTDRTTTVHRGIERLPAAHQMTVTASGTSSRSYWSLDPDREIRFRNDDDYVDAFRELFTESVSARLRGPGLVGATLSGGLDSSSIVCTARALRGDAAPLPTFSLTFPDLPEAQRRLIDERAFIDTVVSGGRVEAHHVRGDRLHPFDEIESVVALLDEPHPALNLYLHLGIYGEARDCGVSVLLDGFDGDSAISHGLGRLNGLARSRKWESFESEVRALAKRRGLTDRYILGYYGLPYMSALARDGEWRAWYGAAREIGRRFGLPTRSLALRNLVAPRSPRWLRSAWRGIRRRGNAAPSILSVELARLAPHFPDQPSSAPTERAMHIEGISQPLYQLTLEIADKSARAFGIEPRYPFFDRRLIEFCVALPDDQKLRDGWPRFLFRRAMEGILPPEIQWRTSKGNLFPNFERAVRTTNRSMLDAVSTPGSKLDRYVDRGAAQRLARRYLASPAGRRQWAEPELLLLFRVGVLARWLEGSSGQMPFAAERIRTNGVAPQHFGGADRRAVYATQDRGPVGVSFPGRNAPAPHLRRHEGAAPSTPNGGSE